MQCQKRIAPKASWGITGLLLLVLSFTDIEKVWAQGSLFDQDEATLLKELSLMVQKVLDNNKSGKWDDCSKLNVC